MVSSDVVPTGRGQDLTGLIASLQERLRDLPEDYTSWASLALAYVEQARVTGDPAYYDKADQAVAESRAAQVQNNAAASAAAAALSAARHDFSGALTQAQAALEVDPYDATALAVKVDALTELGRYDDQLEALRVADRRQPGVPVAARYSYAYELRGRLARAAQILQTAADIGSHADRAYLFTLHADLDRRAGRLREAARHLRLARREGPGYLPALVSRARLAVASGRLDMAVAHWQDVVAQLPLPEYLVELGELHLHMDRQDLAEQQFAVVESTMDLLSRSDVNTDLETALFQADHGDPARALSDARAEWARRRSIHVADVLAWAMHVNGRNHEALRLSRQATRLGTAEARLWLHRGTIEASLGLDADARRHLRHGLAVDPGASPWQADRARAVLRTLGEGQ
jgi:tetratricopeptide (TPR) repeat protein